MNNSMIQTHKKAARWLAVVLTALLALTMMPLNKGIAYAAENQLKTEKPEIIVTGDAVIGGSSYTAENIGREKSYTRAQLKALEGGKDITYSSIKSKAPYTKSFYKASGVYVSSLLKGTKFDQAKDKLSILASDKYEISFNPNETYKNGSTKTTGFNKTRYYFPKFTEGSASGAVSVKTMLAWASDSGSQIPSSGGTEQETLTVIAGQLAADDQNTPLYNKNVQRVVGGNALTDKSLTVNGTDYTRAQSLLMERADRSYTYQTKGGQVTDYVRGVPMSVLLKDYNDNDEVTFSSADGYPVEASGKTVKELRESNYLLGYEKGTKASDLKAIYDTGKTDGAGCFTLYGDGDKPAKMVCKIDVKGSSGIDFVKSIFKHITNGGITGQNGPYDIDGITGATLTIEGPGVKKSVPLSVRDMENQNAGASRGTYSDYRNGTKTERTYEGIDLYHILNNMNTGDQGISLTKDATQVQIKDRNRKTIATLTLDQIKKMKADGNPILVAYGTSYVGKEDSARPFVFDGGAGEDKALGNDDGCLKLVYDIDKLQDNKNTDYKKFGNMAYIYVEANEPPGYKHDKSPYKTAENAQYALTVTGKEIGREVNYTVSQLEEMVKYGADGTPVKDGPGYRDSYSMSNSSYWYVNEYEGVKLWDLLQKSGLPEDKSKDDKTTVKFSATDGYTAFDNFNLKQIADPTQFGYYEKNAADNSDGQYVPQAGDLKKSGYPVLVAYGVNKYPYVVKKEMDGYLSGLENDGGPLRIISGKKDYSHANGSNQAKLLDKVLVGDDTYHYSTHKYTDKAPQKALADSAKINVKVVNGTEKNAPVLSQKSYSVGELEKLLYDGSLTKSELAEAKIKDYYEVSKSGKTYNDLYEGIDIGYFLQNVVQLQGQKGTVTFSNGSQSVKTSLTDLLSMKNGYNKETALGGLSPVIAYAKNGSPLVKSKDSAGYEGSVKLGEGTAYENTIDVKNDNGPMQVIFPRKSKTDTAAPQSVSTVTSVTINLTPDYYAHTKSPYNAYGGKTVKITGEGTRLSKAKSFKVSDLEGKQTMVKTGDYAVRDTKGKVVQQRYRGISLYQFLNSTAVGLKTNADKVIITTKDGKKKTFTLADIMKTDYINGKTGAKNLPMVLAYGSAPVTNKNKETGKPLVYATSSKGYVKSYGNNGGPLKLVVGQKSKTEANSSKILNNVVAIEVTAGKVKSWNHSSSDVFKQYLTETVTLQVVDNQNKALFNKNYTVKELESMTGLIERDEMNSTGKNNWEGINLWKFVTQETGKIKGVSDPISLTVSAKDGYAIELRGKFGLDALQNGIMDGSRYVPIILGYGMDGLPLASGSKANPVNGPGYDSTIGNNGGPIRLITHNAQGSCLSETNKIVVKVGEGGTDTPDAQDKDFNIYGLKAGTAAFDIKTIKNLEDGKGKMETQYVHKNGTDKVRGVYLADLLKKAGITNEEAIFTINVTDQFEEKETSYQNVSVADAIAQKYFVAYDAWNADTQTWDKIADPEKNNDKVISSVRVYRQYLESQGKDPASDWRNKVTNVKGITVTVPKETVFKADEAGKTLPLAGIRSVSFDENGGMWVGTYGGGVAYKAKGAKSFKIYNTASEPALATATVSAVATDKDGGVWMTQNASYTEPGKNKGVLYLKDGKMTSYRASDSPKTIPDDYVQEIKLDKDGNVWFGSFGGLTKYDPKAGTWKTWDQKDGFPAMSIDNLEFDQNGGLWCGFYPGGQGTKEEPFKGGFAYMDKDGKITSYDLTAAYDEASKQSKLGEVWIRDIAVDKDGSAWIVASGSYADMKNDGGLVWHVKPGADPVKYTGDQLLGSCLNGAGNAEVRMVAADSKGGLWLGTSADGVIYASDAAVDKNGALKVTAQFSKETGAWNVDGMNNIYSLDISGETVYAGSSGGLVSFSADQAVALETAKATGIKKVSTAVDAKKYKATEQKKLKQIIADSKVAITGANCQEDIDTAVSKALKSIKALKTSKEIDDQKRLDTAKQNLKKTVSIKVKKAGTTSIKISWNKITGASGYQIYQRTSKTAYSKIKTTTATSYTKTKLKKATVYYYKVRAYQKVNGKTLFGSLSATKTIRLK